MRAFTCALIGALTLTAAGAAAQDMSNMKGTSSAPAAKHGQGTGVIGAIDANAGTADSHKSQPALFGMPAWTPLEGCLSRRFFRRA